MKIDNNGHYVFFDKDPENIDYYIAAFDYINDVCKSLVRKDPETRRAMLEATYKDNLVFRRLVMNTYQLLTVIKDKKIMCASNDEYWTALGDHPCSYGND